MAVKTVTPILNVSSIRDSIAWFELLGWQQGFVWPQDAQTPGFGSVCSGEAQIFLCCGGQGSRGEIKPKFPGDDETDGVWMSWWAESLEAVEALYVRAAAAGMEIAMPPTDEPWGVREFHLRHPDGHTFRVGAGLTTEGPAD